MRVNFSTIKSNIYKFKVPKSAFNINFKGKSTPIIGTDKDGNPVEYPSVVDAAKILGVHKQNIYDYMCGRRKTLYGYTLKYADEDPNNPEKRKKTIQIYAVDKDGNYRKFSSLKEASEELNIDKTYISKNLNGKLIYTNGYVFLYAKDIETKDENGKIHVDTDKIKKVLKYKKTKRTKQIYSVDKDGNYTKFSSGKEASDKLGLYNTYISNNLNGKLKYYKGYVFLYADDLEVNDENGNTYIDVEKINEAKKVLNNKKRQRNERIFYLINAKKQIKKFDKCKSAAKETGLSTSIISNCLSGYSKYAGEYAAVLAQDVEIKNQDGTKSLNEEKIAQIAKELNDYLSKRNGEKQVYVIDKSGNYKKYLSKKSAAEHLGVQYPNIINNINGVTKTVKGHVCISAKDIEVRDKNGQFIGVNQQKLQEAVAVLNPAQKVKSVNSDKKPKGIPVYIIKDNNDYKRYNSILEASKALNISNAALKKHLESSNYNLEDGYCVYASDIETKRADGKTAVDKSKLYNLIKANYKNDDIYIVDVNGFYRKFKYIDEIRQKLSISPITIEKKLNGEPASRSKYFCIKASDVDVIDDNLNLTLDKLKMAEKINELKGPKKQELPDKKQKGHEIYAIDEDGNYKLYSGITEAANKLWIKPWEISNCLGGIVPDVDGYKFVKASDIDTNLKDAQNLHELFIIYAVTAKGNVFKFKSFKDAENRTKIPVSVIKEMIDNPEIKKRGCIFLSSNDVTKLDKDGNFVDDKEKIKEIYYKAFPKTTN